MRPSFLAAILTALLASTGAWADQTDERLDPLFERLQETDDPAEAETLTEKIWGLWIIGKSDRANELMAIGMMEMRRGNPAAALQAFDRLVDVAPDFAEAWNKRATVHWILDEYQKSVDDIEKTLALEPRHFGALSGLGLIYMETGRDDIARAAFERALAVNPHLGGARENIELLDKRTPKKNI